MRLLMLALFSLILIDDPYGSIDDLKLAKPEDKVDMPLVPPPDGAVVLFDGRSFEKWVHRDGKTEPQWKLVEGGAMEVVKSSDIITRDQFSGSFKLHVEFRVPFMPDKKGQQRGNSGVYVQGRYEVQVLDSYGLDSKMDDCAGIYSIAKPLVNACKAPTIWQSYDIEFHAPVFKDGTKSEPGRLTVHHNGVKVHDNVALTKDNTTAGLGGDPMTAGPVLLQDHGNPVQYRNIWLIKLDK